MKVGTRNTLKLLQTLRMLTVALKQDRKRGALRRSFCDHMRRDNQGRMKNVLTSRSSALFSINFSCLGIVLTVASTELWNISE